MISNCFIIDKSYHYDRNFFSIVARMQHFSPVFSNFCSYGWCAICHLLKYSIVLLEFYFGYECMIYTDFLDMATQTMTFGHLHHSEPKHVQGLVVYNHWTCSSPLFCVASS
ncbi:hypothetical protein Dsin_005755 [Dipteronia sinensis]|uniref:Uncharacterized protein n=1 Tax=Dipteronia sinensis TaxID=43782 RepID=A0AAE0EEX3_9ROSI|nr:hypothetical protein Dsin_005755 [Dipteronia sinensis]